MEQKIKARRPLYDDLPDGYMESDRDFVNNNFDACLEFLEEGTMNIKVVYHAGVQIWIAYHEDEYGVGCTYYEAIGRLIAVLAQVREDYTIEFTEEE